MTLSYGNSLEDTYKIAASQPYLIQTLQFIQLSVQCRTPRFNRNHTSHSASRTGQTEYTNPYGSVPTTIRLDYGTQYTSQMKESKMCHNMLKCTINAPHSSMGRFINNIGKDSGKLRKTNSRSESHLHIIKTAGSQIQQISTPLFF